MTMHGMLVTVPDEEQHFPLWIVTAGYSNWLGDREGKNGWTWHVMVPGEHKDRFLAAARAVLEVPVRIAVEEIDGAGEGETYRLLAGEPGTGWEALDGVRDGSQPAGDGKQG